MSLASFLAIAPVKNFLQDGDRYTALQEAAERFDVPEERVNELLDVTDAVLDHHIEPKDIPGLFEEAFGMDAEQAKKFAFEVCRLRLLPLEHFFPSIREQMKEWGGEVPENEEKIELEKISGEEFAARMAKMANVECSDFLLKRLAFLLEQRVNGQKSDESLRTFFGRPLTIGGMGLTKEQIDALMNAVSDAASGVHIVSEEEAAAAKAETINKEVSMPAAPFKAPVPETTVLEISPSHEVAAEVPIISSPVQEARREEAAPKPFVKMTAPSDEKPDIQDKKRAEKAKKLHNDAIKTAFKEAVDIALSKGESLLPGVNIPPAAWADMVGKMLRGIRDQYQTRDILEREYKVKAALLPDLMQVLLDSEEAYRVAVRALGQTDEETSFSDDDAQALEEAEAKRLEEKFVALTKEASKPERAAVELTVGSVAPKNDVSQKKVTDVVAGNKLMGPIEQLGTLTLADFRRLSTNPDEAVRKMEALLAALQKTSYEDRVQGILAWRKSPLAKLSIALMIESLNTGVAVAEIAARRRTQGQESLGPAEMQALVKWNEKTRF